MYQVLKILFVLCVTLLACKVAECQLTISGTVYDSSKTIPVKGVLVKSSSGTTAITDSAGHYMIVAKETDSLTFIYLDKPTAKFAIRHIDNIGNFDISLHIRLAEKYRTMKEVKVYGKNYKQDSIENREQYAKLFNYKKPGLKVGMDSYTGTPGLDLDELINVFRFKRNKQMHRMQIRLEEQEKENYVNYRFNKATVKRVTRLTGNDLDIFMKEYRPDFEFTQNSSLVDFYQYILNASYQYRRELLQKKGG